jgi:FKBP-type peptidyl-prolyl cis-trans isomerase
MREGGKRKIWIPAKPEYSQEYGNEAEVKELMFEVTLEKIYVDWTASRAEK